MDDVDLTIDGKCDSFFDELEVAGYFTCPGSAEKLSRSFVPDENCPLESFCFHCRFLEPRPLNFCGGSIRC